MKCYVVFRRPGSRAQYVVKVFLNKKKAYHYAWEEDLPDRKDPRISYHVEEHEVVKQ